MSKLDKLIKELCPRGVKYVPLKEVCRFQNGFAFQSSKFTTNGEKILRITNISDGSIDSSDMVYFNPSDYNVNFEPFVVKKGDVVVAMSGATTGKIGFNYSDQIFYLNQRVGLFVPNEKKMSRRYLYHWLTMQSDEILRISSGSGAQPNLSSTKMMEFKIPVPPIDIQDEIVRILDNFTNLTTKLTTELITRRKQYEYYRNLLLNFDKSCYKSIGSFSKVCAGATPSTAKSEYWDNGTIRWMNSGEVNLGEVFDTEGRITQLGYDNSSTKMLPINTVVVALAGQGKTRGTVAITRVELCTNQSLCGIIPNNTVNPDFLRYFLQTQYMKLRDASAGDGTRGGLNLKIISSYLAPVPPLEEQIKIVNKLKVLDALVSNVKYGLPAEIEARQKQYEYYRDKLLSFKELES